MLSAKTSVDITVQNATQINVPSGLGGVDVQLTWNSTLIKPAAFVDMLGASGGVLNPSVLCAVTPGFYDDEDNAVGAPYTNATYYRVSGGSSGDGWWGTGIIAEITFQVLLQPTPSERARCELTAEDLLETAVFIKL
jgi:hypothetical protein